MFKFIMQKLLILALVALFMTSCEDTDDKQSIKQIAITLIANYADGTGPEPTIRNYEDAGIIGVNEKNIVELNLFIETLAKEDIDTEEELNAVIDALGVSLASDIFAPVITIHGPNPLTLYLNDHYNKICATAIDNRDGNVTVYILGDVDTSQVGTYEVQYSAVDEAGNLATLIRVVHVILPPPITTVSTTSIPNYYIHIYIDSFAWTPFHIDLTNLSNGDTLNIIELGTPSALPYTLSTPLAQGESYNIQLIETFIPPFLADCQFQGFGKDGFGNVINATGVIGTSDANVTVLCPGP